MGTYLMGMYLTGAYLMGMHLMGMHLMGMHLMGRASHGACISWGVYLIGIHLMDMSLMGMHLTGGTTQKAGIDGPTERYQMGDGLRSERSGVDSSFQLQSQQTRCRIASGNFYPSQPDFSSHPNDPSQTIWQWPDHPCTILRRNQSPRQLFSNLYEFEEDAGNAQTL